MTVIDVPHHLSMGADEGPTPFMVTGDSFIDSVLSQFTSINSMRRFHQSKQLCFRIINVKFLIRGYGIELDQIGTRYLYMENVAVLNQ
jgi:hypothetical protein